MSRRIKRILQVVFVLLIAALLVYAFVPKPVEADLEPVARGALRVTVDEDGKTRIRERYVVSTPLAGRILRIELDAGDPVTAGETLITSLDPTDPELLDARALAMAEARVSAARAAVSQAEHATGKALALQEQADSDYQHLLAASESMAVARNELDDARYDLRVRTQEHNAARFAEEIARFELEQMEAALLHTRPGGEGDGDGAGGRFEIRAPCDGRVLRIFQESAAVVTSGAPLLELGDPGDLELVIDVLSTDAVRIAPDDDVLLEHWGGDRVLHGRVRRVEPSAFTKISALGVEEQRVNVIVDFVDAPEEWRALGDAYRVEARIVVWEGEDVLKVPTSALFRHEGAWAVFTIVDDRAALRPLTIGQRSGLEAEVIDGVEAGDLVVTHPSDRVREGVRVVGRK